MPDGHRFPIAKYKLVQRQLIHEGVLQETMIFDPGLCHENDILLAHTETYWQKLRTLTLSPAEVRKIGLPLSQAAIQRARSSASGTIQSAIQAMENGLGLNIAGGTHHAFADRGEGFCILNDLAIAAWYGIKMLHLKKILIIDLDVHQGNGTAAIFSQEKRVFTFSMHGKDNYPVKKEISDWDIALETGTDDNTYLQKLQQTVPELIRQVQPELVFYQAGVDVLDSDSLGKLNLTKTGCKNRDKMVIEICFNYQIPLVITLGGGYSPRISDIVEAHCNTFKQAIEVYT